MKSRINTKLILILVGTTIAALSLLGGVWYLQMRGDADRAVRIGDDFLRQGDTEKAIQYYRRALSREPGRVEYIQRLEDAILAFVPITTDEAVNRYREYVSVLRHRSIHRPQDVDAHRRLLDELHTIARYTRLPGYWTQLQQEATSVVERWGGEPNEVDFARTFKTMTVLQVEGSRLLLEEVVDALDDMAQLVERMPQEDLARSALISGRGLMVQRLLQEGRNEQATEAQAELRSDLTAAVAELPQGLNTARAVVAGEGLLQSITETDAVARAGTVLRQRVDHMLDLISDAAPAWLVNECVDLAGLLPQPDHDTQVRPILEEYLVSHPHEYSIRLRLARMLLDSGEHNEALSQAQRVVAADPRPVGVLAILRNQFQRSGALMISDAWFRRWEQAEGDERAHAVAELRANQEVLMTLVPDPETNPLTVRVGGFIAFAEGDYRTATAKFEQLHASGQMDMDTLLLDARSLERINEIGRAYDRISEAVAAQPRRPSLHVDKARLEFQMGRFDGAATTLQEALRLEPTNERALALSSQLQAAQAQQGDLGNTVASVILASNQAVAAGDFDGARAVVSEALTALPDNLQLLVQVVSVETSAGDHDAARRALDRAMEVAPNDNRLLQVQAVLDTDDRISATIEYVNLTQSEEPARTVALLYNLSALAERQEAIADQARTDNDLARAEEARQLAIDARAVADEQAAKLESMAPDHVALINVRFVRAQQAKDWPAMEEQVRRARELNADLAGGRVYQGRYEMARGRLNDAMRTFEEAARELHYSAAVWVQYAMACEQAGELTEAVRAYGEAYRCNPTNIDNTRRFARLLERTGAPDQAMDILRDAFNLAPQQASLREQWLRLELQLGDPAAVLRQRLRQYMRTPTDLANLAALAEFLGTQQPARRLLLDETGAEQVSEFAWNQTVASRQQAILAEAERTWREQSEMLLTELEAIAPEPFAVVVLRAKILRLRGNPSAGEELLRTSIEALDPSNRTLAIYLAYAQYLIDINRHLESVPWLERAVAIQDPVRREADAVLANMYLQLGQPVAAITHLERLIEVRDDVSLHVQLFKSHLAAGQIAAAEEVLDRLTANERITEFTSQLLSARLARRRGERWADESRRDEMALAFRQAREALTLAVTLRPDDAEPHLLQAEHLLDDYRRGLNPQALSVALQRLDDAERLAPGLRAVKDLRVDVLLRRQEMDSAILELVDMLRERPTDHQARSRLIQLRVQTGRGEEAIRLAQEGVRLVPNQALWHERLGDLYLSVRGDAAQAQEAYTTAYAIRPGLVGLTKLVDALLRLDPPEFQRSADLISAEQGEVSDQPLVRVLRARAMHGLGRTDEAREDLRASYLGIKQDIEASTLPEESIGTWYLHASTVLAAEGAAAVNDLVQELSGGSMLAMEFRALAQVYTQADFDAHVDRVIELQRQAVAAIGATDSETRASLNFELAMSLLRAERFQQTAEAFEQVLVDEPDHLPAKNNLAFLLADKLDRARDAVAIAEQVVNERPDNAMFLDTLGWARYRIGEYDRAIESLELSVATGPTAGAYVHLATVYLAIGDLANAEARLIKASQSSPDEETQAEIVRLQNQIAQRRASGG